MTSPGTVDALGTAGVAGPERLAGPQPVAGPRPGDLGRGDLAGTVFVAASVVLASGPAGVPIRISIAALCAVGLVVLLRRGLRAEDVRMPGWPLLFLGWCATSLFWSDHPDQTLVGVGTLVAGTLLAIVSVSTFGARAVVRGIVAGATTAAVLSLALVPVEAAQAFDADKSGALRGIYEQSNIGAHVLALGLVSAVCGGRVTGWSRAARVLPVVVLAGALVAAQSSTALVCVAAGIAVAAVVAAVRSFPRGRRAAPATAFAGCVVLLLVLVLAGFGRFAGALGRDTSLTGRTEIWSASWAQVTTAPWLGHGWAAVWAGGDRVGDTIRQMVGYPIDHSHDDALNVALQAGAVGVLLVACTLGQIAITATRRFLTGRGPLGVWPVALVTTVCCYAVTESRLTEPLGWFVVVLLVLLVGGAPAGGPRRLPARAGP
ncbi:O-antigen ligase family protein [Pseudonocardia nematodicida]|uniref:O-antigen ligase family protein n=1 Tax=Pseudonocardia nematodicida TaxID=1206997 RepID=A0ABV1K3U2_9PSEU